MLPQGIVVHGIAAYRVMSLQGNVARAAIWQIILPDLENLAESEPGWQNIFIWQNLEEFQIRYKFGR